MIEVGFESLLASVAASSPLFQPDKTGYPIITYRLLSRIEDESHDGPCGLVAYHYQFTVHADSHLEALRLSGEIIGILQDIDDLAIDSSRVSHVQVTNAFDIGFFPDWDGWQFSIDGIFHVKE